MELNRTIGMLGCTLVCGLATTGMSAEVQTDMAGELASLRSEVAQLKAQQDGNWLNERRAEEVKSLIREVLADADTRASLQNEGMRAGHNGKNFFLSSADGKTTLNVGGQIQFRYIANLRDNASAAVGAGSPADDFRGGFQFRRLKLNFNGNISSPKLGYDLTLAADRDTGNVYLEDAALEYEIGEYFGGKLAVTGGRFKQPFLREELTSSKRQLAVERSSFNEFFTLNRGDGVQLAWTGQMVKVAAMFNDGSNSGDNVGMDFHNDATDLAITSRVDVKLAGDWKQSKDFAAWSGEPLGVFLGAAMHYEMAESGTRGTQPNTRNDNVLQWTIDGSTEWNGLNVFVAAAGMHTDGVVAANSRDHFGAMGQVGYMVIPDKFEPFARYEWISFDGATNAGDQDVNLITVGFNYYLKKHDAKFTMDVVYALDPIDGTTGSLSTGAFPNSASGSSSGLGIRRDTLGQDGQIVMRAQFQLLF